MILDHKGHHASVCTHCAKVQKYEQVKIFLICDTNNVVEHYGKRIKILHGCPFEG